MLRTSNEVNLSFQRIVVFLSSPGSHMEFTLYELLHLQML